MWLAKATERQQTVSGRVIRIRPCRSAQDRNRCVMIGPGDPPEVCECLRYQLPRSKVRRRSRKRPNSLSGYEPWFDSILQSENIDEITVVTLCPLVTSRYSINQLCGDADATSRPSDAPFQNVADAKLTSHLFDIYGTAFVGEAGVSSDDE